MARFELKLPKMGESVAEATITNWLKQVGDKIEADEAVLEVATDKVDSEVPSEVSGVLIEQLFSKDDLVEVGQTIAIIEIEGEEVEESSISEETVAPEIIEEVSKTIEIAKNKVFEGDKTVNEIAYELGFKYPQHFTRLFKQRVGCTPNEYKNLN